MEITEHQIQSAAFDLIRLKQAQDWRWRLIYAIPNGGHRHKAVAARMKAEGVTAGVWDISVDYPVPPYCGLKIEVKTPKGNLTKSQKEMGQLYTEAGYLTVIARSSEEIITAITSYFGLNKSVK